MDTKNPSHKTKILDFNDENYPYLLKKIYKPPQRLFYKGNLTILEKPCISVVGTRRNTDYGTYATQKIINELAGYDLNIVSGLALGIDTIAHQTAINNQLNTIAVLGSGIENIYPRENYSLAGQILENNGLIISEFTDNTEPLNWNFPQRNRIISGLSLATIIIEAPEKSGALITAGFALEQGREIFAVPGDIDRSGSEGILELLQKGGAYPISSGSEIMEILKNQPVLFSEKKSKKILKPNTALITKAPKINYKLTEIQQKILNTIPLHRPQSLEKIIKNLNLPIHEILSGLSILEINGVIISQNGLYVGKH